MSDEQKPKIGVMIATPVRHWRGPESLHPAFRAQLDILAALSKDPECPYEFIICFLEGGLVRARNHIVHEFKKSGCRWMVPWDDDIEATADDVIKLIEHKKPIVAGMYTTRDPKRPHWVANFMHEVELQPRGLLQVIECGTGFKCYHREVFRILDERYPLIAYTDRDTGERIYAYYQHLVLQTDLKPDGDMLTEDFFLDHLCRHAGIGIFVDTTMKLKHRGGNGILYPTGEWPPIPGIETILPVPTI